MPDNLLQTSTSSAFRGHAEIHSFFEQYRDAFNALEGEAVATLYAIPSGIASDTGYEHWPSFEPICKNMVALCDLYRANGFLSARFEFGTFIEQGPDFAVVDVLWDIAWRNKSPSSFNATYNLMRTSRGWRVLLCTAYSEERLGG